MPQIIEKLAERSASPEQATAIQLQSHRRFQEAMASPVFFSWLAQMGDDVRIESPKGVRGELVALISKIRMTYK